MNPHHCLERIGSEQQNVCPVTTYAAMESKTALHSESVSGAGADFCLASKPGAWYSCSHRGWVVVGAWPPLCLLG